MKKLKYLFLLFLVFFTIGTVNVNAAGEEARADKTYKTLINVNGRNVYVSVWAHFNIKNGNVEVPLQIKNVTASYKNNTFYISVKRSDINEVFKETYDNVYFYLEADLDFHDLKANTDYSYFKQNSYTSGVCGYSYTLGSQDYAIKHHNFLQIDSGTIALSGLHPSLTAGQNSYSGGLIVFEGATKSYEDYPTTYCLSDIDTSSGVIFNFDKIKMNVSVVEDVAIDLGENTTIISPETNPTKNEETKYVDINNFYAEYFENNKLKYSWTLYDEDGNPVELNDINTTIEFDNSENESIIYNLFDADVNLKDRIKILSFEHEGELGGTAKISVYVGDKFEAGSTINVYYYNPENHQLEDLNPFAPTEPDETYYVLVDKDGYVTLELTHFSEYVLASSDLTLADNKTSNADSNDQTKMYIYISLGAIITIIIAIIVVSLIKRNKRIKNDQENEINQNINSNLN